MPSDAGALADGAARQLQQQRAGGLAHFAAFVFVSDGGQQLLVGGGQARLQYRQQLGALFGRQVGQGGLQALAGGVRLVLALLAQQLHALRQRAFLPARL